MSWSARWTKLDTARPIISACKSNNRQTRHHQIPFMPVPYTTCGKWMHEQINAYKEKKRIFFFFVWMFLKIMAAVGVSVFVLFQWRLSFNWSGDVERRKVWKSTAGARQVSPKKLSLLSKYSVAIYSTDSFKMYLIHRNLTLSFQRV